jgi:AcrR family transcriptional regulator
MQVRVDKRALASEATKTRILDAAEPLFAEFGLEGVSHRQLAAAAGVDLAMISYHFESKLGLYRAVFRRRGEPLTARRLKDLEQVLQRASKGRPRPVDLVRALVATNIRLRDDPELGGLPFARIIVRELIDAGERERGVISEIFDETAMRFIAAFARAFPSASEEALHWGYHFAIGTMVQTMASTGRLEHVSRGACRMEDTEAVIERLVLFITAGFTAAVDG